MSSALSLRSVVSRARERNVTLLAASVAYYAFVSLIPLALLALALGTLLGGPEVARALVGRMSGLLSASGERTLQEALTGSAGRVTGSLVGTLTLLWGALKVFRGLDLAFDQIYGTGEDPSLVKQLRDGLVTVGAVAGSVVLIVVLGALLPLSVVPVPGVTRHLLLFAGLTVTFLPLYYVMPPVDVSVVEVLPGTALAAAGWLGLEVLFEAYVARLGSYEAYGVIGVVLLFLTFLYFAGVVLLLGTVVNAVRAS